MYRTGDKSKFLDYTLDENDVLIKKPRLLEQSKTKTTGKVAEDTEAEIKEEDTIQKSNVFDNTQADHEADDSKVFWFSLTFNFLLLLVPFGY